MASAQVQKETAFEVPKPQRWSQIAIDLSKPSKLTQTEATVLEANAPQPKVTVDPSAVVKILKPGASKDKADEVKPLSKEADVNAANAKAKEEEDRLAMEKKEKKKDGLPQAEEKDPRAINKKIMKEAIEATKRDLDEQGRRRRPYHEVRFNMKTLQEAIDGDKEVSEEELQRDKAKWRLPSQISATNDMLKRKADS